jgi:hypothetical protein
VAELTGCDHKTVEAWVERQRERKLGPAPRARLTDLYLPLLRAKLDATQGKIRGRQLLRVLRSSPLSRQPAHAGAGATPAA